MEQENDVQLIQSTLSGDDTAFNTLLQKYQKSVHALAWRMIGDYHYAEEIAQDTFLIAYDKLATLRDPRTFEAWLYRIATRQGILFQRKNRIEMCSIEDIEPKLIDKMTYSQFVTQEREKTVTQTHRDVVHRLLKRLPKKQRTVVTLHYLQGLELNEISQMLQVSVNTLKSHLYRARHQLMRAEPMIQELLI